MGEALKRYLRKKYKVLSIRVTKHKLEYFKTICKDIGISQSRVINGAIDQFIIAYETEKPQEFIKSSLYDLYNE